MNNNYTKGCQTYVRYTDDGEAHFEYVRSRKEAIASVLIILLLMIIVINVLLPSIITYVTLKDNTLFYASDINNKKTWNMINDNENLLLPEEKTEIENKIIEYYNKTGVQIVIETINSEQYIKYNMNANVLAEKEFKVNNYDNSYLLILITNYENENIFGLYEGDSVNKVITDTDYKKLYNNINKNEKLKLSLKENLINCINTLNNSFVVPDKNLIYIIVISAAFVSALPFLFIVIALLINIAKSLKRDKKLLKEGYKKVDPTIIKNNEGIYTPKLVTCKYCGGTYMYGEISCPHCNAPGATEENTDNTKSM